MCHRLSKIHKTKWVKKKKASYVSFNANAWVQRTLKRAFKSALLFSLS